MLGRPGPPKAGRWRLPTPGGYRGLEHTPVGSVGRSLERCVSVGVGRALEERWKMALEDLSIAGIRCQDQPFPLVRWRPECFDSDFAGLQQSIHGRSKVWVSQSFGVVAGAENGGRESDSWIWRHVAAFSGEFREESQKDVIRLLFGG